MLTVLKLLRGGSWHDYSRYCRSAFRNNSHPVYRAYSHGFRVCCLSLENIREPVVSMSSLAKLLRGGSWTDYPKSCRSARRLHNLPGYASNHIGFRVCCLPKQSIEIPSMDPSWRMLRGGSWYVHPRACRLTYRYRVRPFWRYADHGFRVCCLPKKTPAIRSERVMMRGGSWYSHHPRFCRSAYRINYYPAIPSCYHGFRVCCLTASKQASECDRQKSSQIKALATEATILMEGSSDYRFKLSWRPGSGAVVVSNGDQAIAVTRSEIDAIAIGVKILLDQEADSTNG